MRNKQHERKLPTLGQRLAAPLMVSEVFGPTVQGEGPAAGRLASFIRLGGCNLTCTWCDAAYTWDGKRFDLRTELTRRNVAETLHLVRGSDGELPAMVVLTGGEPLLQQQEPYGLAYLAEQLSAHAVEVHVETNGTIVPSVELVQWVDLFVVSPKLPHSGVAAGRAIHTEALETFAMLAHHYQAALKVVCKTRGDVRLAAMLADAHGWNRDEVWIMPEGTDAATLAVRHHALIAATLEHGMNASTRLHILAYGDRRGT